MRNWSQTVQSNQSSHQYQIRQQPRGQSQQSQPPYRHPAQQRSYRQYGNPPYRTEQSSSRPQSSSSSSHPSNPLPSAQQSLSQSKPTVSIVTTKSVSTSTDASITPSVQTQQQSPPQDTVDSRTTDPSTKVQSTESTDHKVDDTVHTERKEHIIDTDTATIDHKESDDNQNDVDQQSLASGTTPKKKPFSSSNSVNSKMFFGTRYEVKCDETFAFYEGYVYDYDMEEKKLKVSYPWKGDQTVPVNYVRPLAPVVEPNWKPKQGDHVECQAKAEESEPYGWWDCIIKTVRDNLYLITYEGWDNHHEVLQHNMLRPYNDQEPFEDDGIVRELLPISQERINEFKSTGDLSSMNMGPFGVDVDGIDCCNFNTAQLTISQLKRIAKQTQLIHLNYHPSTEKLVMIGKRQKVMDAKMLINFVWSLREIYKKREESVKTEEKMKQKEYDELAACVRIKFEFNVALTKYVIGTKGENIQCAKNIEGVKHINVRNLDDKNVSECLILALDQNAAEEAREILEMQQDYEIIPAKVRKELIGKDGTNIKRLEERSQVIKICTLDHLKYIRDSNRSYYEQNRNYGPQYFNQSFIEEEDDEELDPDMVKLIIIGPKEKVPFAKMLIKSEVASIQQKRKFIERQLIAKQEINSIHNGSGSKYHNNNDDWGHYNRGYNNDQGYNGYEQQDMNSRSIRRQRRQGQDRDTTQQSTRNTAEFNYLNKSGHGGMGNNSNNPNDPEYPKLGTKGMDGKDLDDAEDNDAEKNNEISWLEHDAAGIAEDEEDERQQNEEEQHGSSQQIQQQRYQTNARKYRGKSQRGARTRDPHQRQYSSNKAKPRWKPKTTPQQLQ